MARSFVLLALLLVFAEQACWSQEPIEAAWIFMNKVEWQTPPPELEKSYSEGDAQLVVLYPSG